MPERSESSDRDIWTSCELEARLSETARCRSSSESLMWSASRKSWGGFVVDMAATCGLLGGTDGLGSRVGEAGSGNCGEGEAEGRREADAGVGKVAT